MAIFLILYIYQQIKECFIFFFLHSRDSCHSIPTLRVSTLAIFTLVLETVLTGPFVAFLEEKSISLIENLMTGTGLSGT